MITVELQDELKRTITWKTYPAETGLCLSEVHIFKIPVQQYDTGTIHYQNVLSDDEISKSSRFLKQLDAKHYIIGRYFLRVILSDVLNIAPAELKFLYSNKKKPYLHGLEFNISHSGDFVVIAINSLPVGIDVEYVIDDFDYRSLSEIFNGEENAKIHGIKDFYKFWTRKEAILKAVGEGLVDQLREIDSVSSLVFRYGSNLRLTSSLLDQRHIMSTAIDASISTYNYWTFKSLYQRSGIS